MRRGQYPNRGYGSTEWHASVGHVSHKYSKVHIKIYNMEVQPTAFCRQANNGTLVWYMTSWLSGRYWYPVERHWIGRKYRFGLNITFNARYFTGFTDFSRLFELYRANWKERTHIELIPWNAFHSVVIFLSPLFSTSSHFLILSSEYSRFMLYFQCWTFRMMCGPT